MAETYEAALRLLDEKDFPDRILLIAHTAREICNSLPEILDPLIKWDRVQYENSLDEIASNWPTITNQQ